MELKAASYSATLLVDRWLLVINYLPFVRYYVPIVLLKLQFDWVIWIFEIKKIQYFLAKHDTYLGKNEIRSIYQMNPITLL